MVHNFKTAVKGDDVSVKKMAPPEREAHLAQQRRLLRALDITGPLDLCAFTGSLKQVAAPGKELDPYIAQLENDVTVTYFMLPLPASHAKSDFDDKGHKKRNDAALKQTDDAPTVKPPKKAAKGAGKGKFKRTLVICARRE